MWCEYMNHTCTELFFGDSRHVSGHDPLLATLATKTYKVEMQCAAVTTQYGVTNVPPQKNPPRLVCKPTLNKSEERKACKNSRRPHWKQKMKQFWLVTNLPWPGTRISIISANHTAGTERGNTTGSWVKIDMGTVSVIRTVARYASLALNVNVAGM